MPYVDGSTSEYTYFGIIGLTSTVDVAPYGSREIGFFTRIQPSSVSQNLYRAVSDRQFGDALVRYAPSVTYELAIKNDFGSTRDVAVRIINALRVKTRLELLVPASLSVSWSQIDNCKPATLSGELLEDMPAVRALETPREVDQEDFDWLWSTGELFETLLTDRRFRLAVESLCYFHLMRGMRMMTAALWAGIEALCGVREELRYRLALIAACVLEHRGERRIAMYKRVQKLYDTRSLAIHGAEVSESDLLEHVLEVRILLSNLLLKCLELKLVPGRDDVDRFLLT